MEPPHSRRGRSQDGPWSPGLKANVCLAARHLPQETPCLPPAHMWFPCEATHAAEGSLPPQPLRLLNTDEQLPSVINHGPTAEILMIVNNAVGNIFVCLDFLLLSGYSRGCVFIRDQGSKVWTLGGGGLGTTLASFMAGGVVLCARFTSFPRLSGLCGFLKLIWTKESFMTQETFTLHHLLQCFPHLLFQNHCSIFSFHFFFKQISSLYTVKSVRPFLAELLPLLLPSLGNCPHKQEGQRCPGSLWPGFPAAGHRQWAWQLTWFLFPTWGPAQGPTVGPYTLHPAMLVPAPLSDLNLSPGTLAW